MRRVGGLRYWPEKTSLLAASRFTAQRHRLFSEYVAYYEFRVERSERGHTAFALPTKTKRSAPQDCPRAAALFRRIDDLEHFRIFGGESRRNQNKNETTTRKCERGERSNGFRKEVGARTKRGIRSATAASSSL